MYPCESTAERVAWYVAQSSLTRHEDTNMIFLCISIHQGRTISASDRMNSTTLAHALTVCCICSH